MTEATLSAKVTADIADFTKKFSEMRGSIDKLGRAGDKPARELSASIGKIKEDVSSVSDLLKAGSFIGAGAAITAGVTIPLINLGREAVLMADKLRQSEIAFTVMLGSAAKATDFLRDLQAFAARTPFEFPELQQAAKKMLALGFSAEQVIPTLTNVGNAVSGLGGDAGVFNRIILAMGQIQAKGQLMSQEMRQLAEAGIPAWELLAKHLGVTVPEAMEMVTERQVDGATALTALQAGMAAKFGGLMEQQALTIQGTMANLKDTIGFIMTDIGREIIDTLKLRDGLAAVQDFAKGFLAWFRQLDQGTKQVLLAVTGAFAVGGPMLVVVGAFMAATAVVTAPLLVGGAIVVGLVAGVTLILLNWQKIKDTGTAIWNGAKNAVVGSARAIYDGLMEWLVNKPAAIAAKVQSFATSIAKPFEALADHLVGHSVIPDMVEDIGRHMELLDVSMSSPARTATANTGRIIEGGVLTWGTAISQFASTVNFGWGSITQTIGSSLAQMTTQTVNWAAVGLQIGQQFLGNMITLALQLLTQWVLTYAGMQSAHVAMEAAKTVATTTGEAARLAIVKASGVAMSAAMITTLAAIVGVGNAALAVASAVVIAIAAVLKAAATAAALIPGGQGIAGALLVGSFVLSGAGIGAIAAGAGAIQAAAGAAIVAMTAGIPAFANGGAVFGPTLAVVGENATRSNPEFIGHANQLGLNQGGGNLTIILQQDGRETARSVMKYLHGLVYMKMGTA